LTTGSALSPTLRRYGSNTCFSDGNPSPRSDQSIILTIARRTASGSRGHADTIKAKSDVSNSVSTEPTNPCFPDDFCDKWPIANPPSWVCGALQSLTEIICCALAARLSETRDSAGVCGILDGLKIPWRETSVRVRSPLRPMTYGDSVRVPFWSTLQ
jgi:hypothetical protein